jgi:hypothetical protein
MAGRIAYYGNIVRNGLILNLDAAKKDSYPGSGTTWRDIASGLSANITGPVTFSTGSIPALSYSGNGWVYISPQPIFTTLLNNFTILGWINPSTAFGGIRVFGLGYISQWQLELRGGGGTALSINYNNGGGNIFQTGGPTISINTWQQVGFVINNSVVNFIYNGQISATGAFTVAGNFANGNQNYSIGNYNGGFDGVYPGQIASHQVYNRVLSAAEVLQNYNAQKSRYGL